MTEFLYANATSIFDYSDGACSSLVNIFERITNAGHKVFVVTGCTSTNISSYNYSKWIWGNNQSKKSNLIYRFIQNGVYYSLAKTSHWDRNSLTSFEQESIYREAISILDKTNVKCIIGWGNLLLEESIFKEAKSRNLKTIFYLVNSFYKDSGSYILKNCDAVITDSLATKNLYNKDIEGKCIILPKVIKEPKEYSPEINLVSKNCLFVNPVLEKGLEPFLLIAKYIHKNNPQINLICRDAKGTFKRELKKINQEFNEIPSNILIKNGTRDKEELFKDIKVLLVLSICHESSSILIYEAYCRGIPVIAFNVGGNKELIGDFKENLFLKPDISKDQNSNIRTIKWNPDEVAKRIKFIIDDTNTYKEYSKKIKKDYEKLRLDEKSLSMFNNLIKKLTI